MPLGAPGRVTDHGRYVSTAWNAAESGPWNLVRSPPQTGAGEAGTGPAAAGPGTAPGPAHRRTGSGRRTRAPRAGSGRRTRAHRAPPQGPVPISS